MAGLIGILFDGVAFAMILFIITIGLSVTMGVMGFANLAHGAVAMAGGYVTSVLTQEGGQSFLLALAASFLVSGLLGLVMERTLFRRLYGASGLVQVLLSIGVVFIAVAAATYVWGPTNHGVRIPDWLAGRVEVAGKALPIYRLFLIACGLGLALAIWLALDRTLVGSQIRAAVANRRMAEACGIDVAKLLAATFVLGSGLAGLGGALAVNVVGITPYFAIEYLVLFLFVVIVGGLGSIRGSFVAALVLGIADTAGKYYLPAAGSFLIYLVTLAVLLWRPAGLFARG